MAIIGTLPNILQNGTVADATQVMADFNFIVNQVNANAASGSSLIPGGQLSNIQAFTVSGTYTPSPGVVRTVVELVGGGGAGGGAVITAGGQVSVGGGGGAGGYVRASVTPAIQAFTIGSGGTGVAGAGGNFGTSSFFGALTAAGGAGGFGSAAGASTTAGGGNGGAGSGGNILNLTGAFGAPGWADTSKGITGAGGASLLGAGGASVPFFNSSGSIAAAGYGGGGGGALNAPSQAALAGGNGRPGVLIVYEFI